MASEPGRAGHGPAPGRLEGRRLVAIHGDPTREQARGQPHVERPVDVGPPRPPADPHLDRSAAEAGGERRHRLGQPWSSAGDVRPTMPPPGPRRGRLARSPGRPARRHELAEDVGPVARPVGDGVGGDVVEPGAAGWTTTSVAPSTVAARRTRRYRTGSSSLRSPAHSRMVLARSRSSITARSSRPTSNRGSIPSPGWASMCGVSDDGAEELAPEVGLLVGRLRPADGADGVAGHRRQPLRHHVDRLAPGRLLELARRAGSSGW